MTLQERVTDKVQTLIIAAWAMFAKYWAMAAGYLADHFPSLEDELHEVGTMRSRAAQTSTIIAGVVIGATLLIGFFVVASINSALPSLNDSQLQDEKNSTVDRIGQGMLIGGVVIIVLFSAVILRVLRGL